MKKIFSILVALLLLVSFNLPIFGQQKSVQQTTANKASSADRNQTTATKPKTNTGLNTGIQKTSTADMQSSNQSNRSSTTSRSNALVNQQNRNTNSTTNNTRQNTSLNNEVVVTTSRSSSNNSSSTNNQTTENNTSGNFIDQLGNQFPIGFDPTIFFNGNQSSGQKKILGNSLMFDSTTNSLQLFGQQVISGSDVFNLVKSKVLNRNSNQNNPDGPVNADDFSMAMVKRSSDISSEAEKAFKKLRKSDAAIKAMDTKLVSSGMRAMESFFGREIQYQGMDGSIKTIKLYLQKYERGEEKFCLAHVEVSAKGNSQSLESSACFMKDMNGEAQIIYLQDCFGLIITPGATASSMPCAGDFNWEMLRGGMGSFL